MGCSSSSPSGPKPANDRNGIKKGQLQIDPDTFSNMFERFESIVSGCELIGSVANMIPILCLTDKSFPLVVCDCWFAS